MDMKTDVFTWCREALALENMPQMAAARSASNFYSTHSPAAVFVSVHGTRNSYERVHLETTIIASLLLTIKECGPTTSTLDARQ